MGDYSKSTEIEKRQFLKSPNLKNTKSNNLNSNLYDREYILNSNNENDNRIECNTANNLIEEKKEFNDSKFQFNLSKSGIKENKRYSIPKEDTGRYDPELEKDVYQIPSKLSDNLISDRNNNKSLISNELTFNEENINSHNFNNNNFPKIKNPFDNFLPNIKNPFDSINNQSNLSNSKSIINDKNFQSLNEIKKRNYDNNLLKSSFTRRSAAQSQNLKKKNILTSFASSKYDNSISNNLEYSQSQNTEINFSKDIKFEIIDNEEGNKKNKRNNLQNIIESDEENEGEETLRKLNLDDIVIFVKKFNDGNYNLNTPKNKYEIGKKICEIINNNPFQNIPFKILYNSHNFSNFFNMTNEQLIEKIDKEFYENFESINKFEKIIKKYHHKEFKNYYTLCISEIYPIELQELKAYRTVLCDDGNGFLRAFIFNLFEVFIINKNIKELRKISYEISTKISIKFQYNNISVEKEEIIIIMKIIITHLENSNINDALLVFTNAFLYHSSFEFGLIKFIRIALGNFITNNKDLFNLENLKELIPFKYIEHNKFNYNLYITERVMIMDYEIDSFIFYILPHLFNINLKFFLDNNSISLLCNYPDKNNGTIKIIYDFSYYKIGYDSTFMNYNSKYIPYISNDKIEKYNIILLKNDIKTLCENCKEIPNEYVKVHKIFDKICRNCLVNYLKDAIKKRIKFFIEDFYLHEEYYCSEIEYTNSLENNLAISNVDIKLLFNVSNGIPTIIRNNIKNTIICNLCNSKFENKIAYTLICGCIFCKDCIQKFILDKTRGKIILNEYEKKQEKIIINCPKCNSLISNYNNFIEKFFDVEKYKKESEERLKNQITIECCVCRSNDIFFSFDLLVNKINLKHSLCKNCKNNLDEQLKKDRKRSYQTQFKCQFCNNEHVYNIINFNNESIINEKKNKNKCCSIF